MRQLNYPVLFYTPTSIWGKNKSETYLCTSTISSFKEGFFDNGVIIDASGLKYRVLDYNRRLTPYVALVNVVDALLELFLRPKDEYCTWIDFTLSDPEQLSFDEVKQEITDLVNKHPRWFVKSHENENTIEEKLSKYDSLRDLIECLAGYP